LGYNSEKRIEYQKEGLDLQEKCHRLVNSVTEKNLSQRKKKKRGP